MAPHLQVAHAGGAVAPLDYDVGAAYNFGYAGRTRQAVQAHIDELVQLGLTPPARVPSVYVMRPGSVTTAATVRVCGRTSYGEVEFALLKADSGWLVAAGSDHSEFAIESASTAYAKIFYPDVISESVWLLDEIRAHWDALRLTAECAGDDGVWQTVQEGSVAELLAPADLMAELRARTGGEIPIGTVIMSGTIGGEIVSGARSWRCSLHDPVLGRTLTAAYHVVAAPEEI